MRDSIFKKSKTKRNAERNKQQGNKLESLGRFAGGVAHDFNNVLSIIEGHTSIALLQLEENRLEPEQLKKVLRATQRGAGLTRQLLSFGRMKVDVEKKINLANILKEMNALLNPIIGKSIKLFLTVPDEAVWVNASEDQLTQIILNLVLNARDAMPEGGELIVMFTPCQIRHVPKKLRKKNPGKSFIRLSVADSGEGISKKVLSKIFDPFFTTKEQGQGTGLGLSVVYGLVDQLNGSIEVSSLEEGGTSFDIFLPEVSPPAEISSLEQVDISGLNSDNVVTNVIPTPKKTTLSGKTILVVEDESELREILSDTFEAQGMKVMKAADGNEALVVQDEYDGKIDFLLTDVVMPDIDGLKLSKLFRNVRPDSDIVYMSGYPFGGDDKNVSLPDDVNFISKPFEEGKLQQILEEALRRRKERLGEEE